MFTNRVSLSVPKLSETYRSVQPAKGVSGPSSRSMINASASDLAAVSERNRLGFAYLDGVPAEVVAVA